MNDATVVPNTETQEDKKLNINPYIGLTMKERVAKITSIAAETPYDPFIEVKQTTTKFLDAVYYFFKEELGFVDEIIDEIKVTLKDKSTKTYTNIPVLKGNRNWMSEDDIEKGNSNTLYIFYDIEKSPRVGFSYQARGKGGRLDYITYLSGVHIDEQGQIRNINPDPKIANDILKNRLKSFSVGSKGNGKKSNSRAANAIISTDDAILEANTSLWELPAPTGKPDPSAHLIPNRRIIKPLLTGGNKGKTYGYVTKSTWSYNKIDNDQTIEQHKIETWRKGDSKKEGRPLKLQGGVFDQRNLEELIQGGHRISNKPFSSHTCFIPEIEDSNFNFHKNNCNCPDCYPDTVSNRPNDLKPYLFDDVARRLETGDYCFYGIIVVNSEKTADIWRKKGFLVIKLFGSETTAFHYFHEQQAELLAKLVYNRNIDIFVEVEKDPTGMDRLAHKLISSMVGPLVRHTLYNDDPTTYPSKTEIIAFTYHGDLKDKIDGEKAIASGLTVDQITTGLSQIKTNYIDAKQETLQTQNDDKLSEEEKAARKEQLEIPLTPKKIVCPDALWIKSDVPDICQKYKDAIIDPETKEKTNATAKERIEACEICYTNTTIKEKLLENGIRNNQLAALLPNNELTRHIISRINYIIKRDRDDIDFDFTDYFVCHRFSSSETDAIGLYTFYAHNHKDGPIVTIDQVIDMLKQLDVYDYLVDVGFEPVSFDNTPYSKSYLDNQCGRLIKDDSTVFLNISDIAKQDNVTASVSVKSRPPRLPVLDEDGKPKIFSDGSIHCFEFKSYYDLSRKGRSAIDKKATTLVANRYTKKTRKGIDFLKEQEAEIQTTRRFTNGGNKIYYKDLKDFKIGHHAWENEHKITEQLILSENKLQDALKDDSYLSQYYTDEHAAVAAPGIVFGDEAVTEMKKFISIKYQVNIEEAAKIYEALDVNKRIAPGRLPDTNPLKAKNPFTPEAISKRRNNRKLSTISKLLEKIKTTPPIPPPLPA